MDIKILHMIDRAKQATGTTVVIDVFHEKDFFMCTEVDKFDFVMRIKKSDDGLDYMEKI